MDVAVAIVVAPGGAGHEAAAADTGLVCDVFKLAAAKMAVEGVAGVSGDEEIELAIVVVVGDGDAHAPAFAGQTGCGRDVLEGAIRFLMVEGDHRVAAVTQALDSRAVD